MFIEHAWSFFRSCGAISPGQVAIVLIEVGAGVIAERDCGETERDQGDEWNERFHGFPFQG